MSAEDLYWPYTSTIIAQQVQKDSEDLQMSVYTNKSAGLVVDWQNTRSAVKSNNKINRLVHKVILHPEFRLDDLKTFNAAQENQKADKADMNSPLLQSFQHADIQISIPLGSKDISPCLVAIPSLYFHKLTSLIKEVFESPLSSMFHFTPFKMFHMQPNGKGNECIFLEMYDSDIFWEEHKKVQHTPTDDLACKWEKVITTLMFWSNATHLV